MTTRSARQTRSLAEALNQAAKEAGHAKGRIEGAPQSVWVLLDFGEVVVHVLTQDARDFYRLDQLWADAPEVPIEADSGGSSPEQQAQAG